MTGIEFNKIVDRRCKRIQKVLNKKEEEEYVTGSNRFHNFYVASEIMDCTPPEALLGMASNHIYSVIDMLVAQGIDPYLFETLSEMIEMGTKDIINDSTKKGKHRKTHPNHLRRNKMKIETFCPHDGINVKIDEDGACVHCGSDAYGKELDALNKLIQNWISVKDRLPEELGNYLVWCDSVTSKMCPIILGLWWMGRC